MDKKRSEAEKALRTSEEKYRTLFDSIDEGFVVAELLFDEAGKPFDLWVLETNASFEQLMRTTTSSVGKRALEIFPNAEASWFEAYGRVVETGEALRFENYLAALDRWFDLYISRIGGPDSRRFAIVFKDISERKKSGQELQRTNELLQATLDNSLEDIQLFKAVRDENGAIVDFVWLFTNKKWNDQWGQMGGKRLLQENPGIVETGLFDKFVSVTESGIPIVHEQHYAHEQFNGWFLQSLVKVDDGFLATTLEITERKLAEEALREAHRAAAQNERQLARELEDTQQLQKISSQLIQEDNIEALYHQILNAAIALMHADMGSLQMFDSEQQELHLLAWQGFHPESAAYWATINGASATVCGRALRTGQRQIVPDVYSPDFVTDSEQLRQYHLSGIQAVQSTPLLSRHGRPVGMLSTHWRAPHVPGEREWRLFDVLARQAADIVERARAEEALRESEQRLKALNETLEQKVVGKMMEVRRLASDVIHATQRERQRISHVLHDDLQQRIFAIQMQMSLLRDGLPSENAAARQEASDIEQELAEIVKIARDLSIDLGPPILPGEGLSQAIHWLTARMREQYGLPVELRANGTFMIASEDLHMLLFNFVRELLFNIVKHAEASRAVVALAWVEDGLRIEVHDDGKGFPDDGLAEEVRRQTELPRSLGLPTIRQQLSLFGGSLEILSRPGAGSQVILMVPIAEAQPGGSSSADTP